MSFRTPQRDALRTHLRERGIETGIHYPRPSISRTLGGPAIGKHCLFHELKRRRGRLYRCLSSLILPKQKSMRSLTVSVHFLSGSAIPPAATTLFCRAVS